MTFVARPPAALPQAEVLFINDGFFPDIDLAVLREEARITTSITGPRLRAAVKGAVITAALDLRLLKVSAIAAGYLRLADINAERIDGESMAVISYLRAIAFFAKAELIERHRDFDTTAAGGSQADELSPTIADLRRDGLHCLRDLLGRNRTTVEMI